MSGRNINTVSQICADADIKDHLFMEKIKNSIYVAMPAIVIDFDIAKQTLSAQPAIRQKLRQKTGTLVNQALPVVYDVPFHVNRGGGWACTMPVKAGDECLLVFCDLDFGAWWQNGGIQNQEHLLKHNLGSAMAILGFTSVPQAIANYNNSAIELRNLAADEKISIASGKITLKSATIDLIGTVSINGAPYMGHKHTSAAAGSPTSGVI